MPPSAWAHAVDPHAGLADVSAMWLGAWSPLRPIADIARGLLRAPAGIGLLGAPRARSGAFVIAGAPGALERDLRTPADTSGYSELSARRSSTDGTFRRPFDVIASQATAISGQGWASVGSRAVAVGRFVVDRESNAPSTYTSRVLPYAASPFVSADSVTPPMQRAHARLEGGLGLRLGAYGLGATAAIDSREHNSVDFPLRRNGRAVTPAAALGVERALPWRALRVGVFYRWTEPNETQILNPIPLITTFYPVQGLDEPPGIGIRDGTTLFVRTQRRATATGGSLSLRAFDTDLALTVERGRHADDQYLTPFERVRATDRWRATGTEVHAQVQRRVGARLHASLLASHERTTGAASRADLTGRALAGDDMRSAVELALRAPVASRWEAAMVGGVVRQSTQRTDYVAQTALDAQNTQPFVSGEVARRARRVHVAAGASFAMMSPTGTIPPLVSRGPNYIRFVAPEVAYDVSNARAFAGWLTLSTPIGAQLLALEVRMEHASPTSLAPQRYQPDGERRTWVAALRLRR
jgi:hypothetical protein